MKQPAYARLTIWGGSRDVIVWSDPPAGLEVALKEVDAELDTLRLDGQDTYEPVPSLLVLLTGDVDRAKQALSQAYDRLEAVQARLAAENAAAIPF